ncbi:urea amidolyase related protein [Mizugakiibacter sediminis]|uniref:KipI antagonist n=1 Tax=Mizugakiibacter sediminis TaxID=1475481 RepID=A0A0K8QJ46_9GAMM|nr:biotin-dependent carboxyltransferase family protein [Mizugakiibacter sediminis]GAP64965.1 urea amidolyase related protein [Mizugakiibacter sediminis]
MSVEVLKPGLLTTPQDRGRVGLAHLGIGRAGAMDAPALRLANALAGNPANACALEITLLGPTLRFHADADIALTGAPVEARVDGARVPLWAPLRVRAGATLALGGMRQGCRSYLAVRGGFALAPVLGSRSLDVNAALGPLDGRALRAGDVLAVGMAERDARSANRRSCASSAPTEAVSPGWSLDSRPWFDGDAQRPLRLLPGTHGEHLDAASQAALFDAAFRVAADSNRVGYRLEGPRLALTAPLELVSEAGVAGTVQLPPSGQPIVLMAEHPVSGGYPRIGHVAAVDLPRLAQRRPGDAVRFVATTPEEARHRLAERERRLQRLEAAIALRLARDA